MGVGESKGSLVPVTFSQEICETPEKIRLNIESSLKRSYTPFNDMLRSTRVSIVGSGPSLKRTLKSIRGDVFACNAAHDFLVAHGIVPKYGMLWDADQVVTKFVTPRKDVTYLLASRCHPSVFEQFEGYKYIVWHAGGDKHIDECLEESRRYEPLINGGSAAVTRSLFMCFAMGYAEMHLFGVDSSCEQEETHVRKSVVPEKLIDIYCHDQWFKTTAWLAVQAEDFKLLAPSLRDAGVKIVVHGDGLIPHIARALEFEVHPTESLPEDETCSLQT